MESETYRALNKAWKSTTRVIFGEELGELKDYADWLKKYVETPRVETSALSGRQVHLGIKDYCEGAKFITFDEVDLSKKFEPLTINEIKDIDSVIEALQERIHYTGSVVLGNSKFVEASSNVVDSHYIYNSIIASDSKYAAYSDTLKLQEYTFGTYGDAESSYIIKCIEGYKNKRNFECHCTYLSSDCLYSANLQNCAESMFSFGAQSKTHMIGNLELPRDKYREIKSKVLSEIVEILKKEKRIFSLYEILEKSCKFSPGIKLAPGIEGNNGDMGAIEKAFSNTTSLVLGKELKGIDNYAKLLQKHAPNAEVIRLISPLTGKRVLMAGYFSRFARAHDVSARVVSENEVRKVGEMKLEKLDAGSLALNSDALSKVLHPIAYIAFETTAGANANMIECAIITNSADCYKGTAYVYAKKCGYSFWPRHSEHMFGACATWNSAFCINTYYSQGLTRSFEADSCENSSDLYFSHNCENVHDSMFCFNVKNLKNAIGNAQIPQDKYRALKKSLLEQVAGEIEGKKDFKWDIYNLGCLKKRS
ncbi:MAG: hypothetical protein V1909_05090 [Candidatus Micrarchaeota archaeon]